MAELVSKCRAINNKEAKIHVTYRDAFHWATLGGAKALGIDNKVLLLEKQILSSDWLETIL